MGNRKAGRNEGRNNIDVITRNQGELAEGWYDPATLEKARTSVAQMQPNTRRDESQGDKNADMNEEGPEEEGEDEEDEYGPVLPTGRGGGLSLGPTIPTMQDLELRKGMLPTY